MMKIYVDIDGTICTIAEEADYTKAEPIPERIEKINDLYDQGNQITYWTGRGTVTGKSWTTVTRNQLKAWGCRYHALLFGKPDFDLYICDKSKNAGDL